jgi:hypothetical protein
MGRRLHGRTGSREHNSWKNAKRRCLCPTLDNWSDYGGRGITMCARWLSGFIHFDQDMGPCPDGMSIDRIDNDGGYWCGKCEECVRLGHPANCRWANQSVQSLNQRVRVGTVTLECNGVRGGPADWARELGLTRQAIHYRLRCGWSPERICTAPRTYRVKKGDEVR